MRRPLTAVATDAALEESLLGSANDGVDQAWVDAEEHSARCSHGSAAVSQIRSGATPTIEELVETLSQPE